MTEGRIAESQVHNSQSILRISVVVELVKVVDPHAASEGHLFVVDIVRTRGARA